MYGSHKLNSKLHAVCDGLGRPIILLLSDDQTSYHKGAALLSASLPCAKVLLCDKRGLRQRLAARQARRARHQSLDPPLRHRKVQHHYDKQLYRQCHKIENIFARIKDWRRVAARYAHTLMSAISIAATVYYWL